MEPMGTVRTIKEGERLLVKGPARITLQTGRIRIDGSDRSRYTVKEKDTCILEGVQLSTVAIVESPAAHKPPPTPRIWLKYSHEILQKKGIVVVIGAPDTGKTTFTTFLANQALKNGISVAVIDSDIGQSDIGPPSTIGLAFVRHEIARLEEVAADAFYFVGTTSVTTVCDMVLGVKALVEKADNQELIIIDTCGYVFGTGKRLKTQKLQAVNPDFVVALQKKNELYPILREWHGHILKVDVLKGVKKVPRHIRKEIRESRWKKAFAGAKERQIDLEEKTLQNTHLLSGNRIKTRIFKKMLQCNVLYAEEIPEGFFIIKKDFFHEYKPPNVSISSDTLKMIDAGWEENVVVGLSRKGEFVDIGTVKRINYKNMMAVISCKEHEFDTIKFGRIKVDESGSEQGFIDWC